MTSELKEAIERRLGELLDGCDEAGLEECELRYKGVSAHFKKKLFFRRPKWIAWYNPINGGWSLKRLEFVREVELALKRINDRKQNLMDKMEMEQEEAKA